MDQQIHETNTQNVNIQNFIACYSCHAAISKTAIMCPYCGGKNFFADWKKGDSIIKLGACVFGICMGILFILLTYDVVTYSENTVRNVIESFCKFGGFIGVIIFIIGLVINSSNSKNAFEQGKIEMRFK